MTAPTDTHRPVPTMNAVQVDAWGNANQLRLRRIPRPSPGPGEVLIRISNASVNAVDKRVREGYMDGRLPLPYTAGGDFSGVVQEAGEGADLVPGTVCCCPYRAAPTRTMSSS